MTNRHSQLLDELAAEKRLEVSALAGKLGVSQVTVRKDLDHLEKLGLVKREHGLAVIGSSEDLNNRLAYHYEAKQRIAKEAAGCVEAGETVLIESGSCCALLAEELARSARNITIITNSAFIAGYIRQVPNVKLIMLGGNFQPASQVMTGPLVHLCAEQFFVDKLFIGTDGFKSGYGFTGSDMMRAEAVKVMSRQANKVIILTESQKFSSQGIVSLIKTRDVHAVYTDTEIPAETEQFLRDNSVAVFKA